MPSSSASIGNLVGGRAEAVKGVIDACDLLVAKPFGGKQIDQVTHYSMVADDRARRWVQTWKSAGDALAQVKARELRELSQERSAELALTFTFDPATTWRSPDRRDGQGLIEQQRYFMKHHEHPIRRIGARTLCGCSVGKT